MYICDKVRQTQPNNHSHRCIGVETRALKILRLLTISLLFLEFLPASVSVSTIDQRNTVLSSPNKAQNKKNLLVTNNVTVASNKNYTNGPSATVSDAALALEKSPSRKSEHIDKGTSRNILEELDQEYHQESEQRNANKEKEEEFIVRLQKRLQEQQLQHLRYRGERAPLPTPQKNQKKNQHSTSLQKAKNTITSKAVKQEELCDIKTQPIVPTTALEKGKVVKGKRRKKIKISKGTSSWKLNSTTLERKSSNTTITCKMSHEKQRKISDPTNEETQSGPKTRPSSAGTSSLREKIIQERLANAGSEESTRRRRRVRRRKLNSQKDTLTEPIASTPRGNSKSLETKITNGAETTNARRVKTVAFITNNRSKPKPKPKPKPNPKQKPNKLPSTISSSTLPPPPPPPTTTTTTSTPWVKAYVQQSNDFWLLEVPRDFIMDGFNLAHLSGILEEQFGSMMDTGTASEKKNVYKEALKLILDPNSDSSSMQQQKISSSGLNKSSGVKTASTSWFSPGDRKSGKMSEEITMHKRGSDPFLAPSTMMNQHSPTLCAKNAVNAPQDEQAVVGKAAEALYLMIHARYIASPRGLEAMRRKVLVLVKNKAKLKEEVSSSVYHSSLFCPNDGCQSNILLPYGKSDRFGRLEGLGKRYCCYCGQAFPVQGCITDGCAWGPSFCHLFLLTHGVETFPFIGNSEVYTGRAPKSSNRLSSQDGSAESAQENMYGRAGKEEPCSPTPAVYGFAIHPFAAMVQYPLPQQQRQRNL